MSTELILSAHRVDFVIDNRAKFRTGHTIGNIVTTKLDAPSAAAAVNVLTTRPDTPFAIVTRSGMTIVLRVSGSTEIAVMTGGDESAQAQSIAGLTAVLREMGATAEPVAEEAAPRKRGRKTETVVEPEQVDQPAEEPTEQAAEPVAWVLDNGQPF